MHRDLAGEDPRLGGGGLQLPGQVQAGRRRAAQERPEQDRGGGNRENPYPVVKPVAVTDACSLINPFS